MGNLSDLKFDADEVEPMGDWSPIPAGEYLAAVIGSEKRETAAGNGTLLSITWSVVEGEHKGRQLFTNILLDHPTPKAVEIGAAKLSAICRAVGVLRPQDSSEFHGKLAKLKVAVKRRKDNDEMQNEITGYEPTRPAATPPRQRAGTVDETAPW